MAVQFSVRSKSMNWTAGAGDLWYQGKVFVSGTDTNGTENFGKNG